MELAKHCLCGGTYAPYGEGLYRCVDCLKVMTKHGKQPRKAVREPGMKPSKVLEEYSYSLKKDAHSELYATDGDKERASQLRNLASLSHMLSEVCRAIEGPSAMLKQWGTKRTTVIDKEE